MQTPRTIRKTHPSATSYIKETNKLECCRYIASELTGRRIHSLAFAVPNIGIQTNKQTNKQTTPHSIVQVYSS
jgi:hypothetical protein